MNQIECKTRLLLEEAIEKIFEDEELLEQWNMWWSGNYASIMADAALSVLRAQKDIQSYLKDQDLLTKD